MRLALALFCVGVAAQSRDDLLAQQQALNQARQETDAARAAGLYQKFIDRYGGDAVWDEVARRGLAADLMKTQSASGKWTNAERIGAAALRIRPVADEVAVRRIYAQALDHLGRGVQAGEERVALLSLIRRQLLASEIRQPAKPLIARTIDDGELSLAKLRGKPVIVAFWATWCAPCIDELRQLNLAYPQLHDRAEILAIDTDDPAQAAADYARKNGYSFAVLKSDSEWPVSTIPQLFVIDAKGDIRFRVEGFDDDGFFAQKLGWMLEAAAKR